MSRRNRRRVRETAPVSDRARGALDELHARQVNVDLSQREELTEDAGWTLDDHRRRLPSEPPGPPVAGGPWEIARRLIEDYEFADPGLVRAVYYPDAPLDERDMLLEARFLGMRFLLGLRVGGVTDHDGDHRGRPVRVWGWNYRTLSGHLEMGQMDYEVWKWKDTGEVEFRIHAVSRPARIANPLVRLGFALFGRMMQLRYVRRSLDRLEALVEAELAGQRRPPSAVDEIEVRPAIADARAGARLEVQRGGRRASGRVSGGQGRPRRWRRPRAR